MAITRLTDLITIFQSKWIYGDSRFEYDFEVNSDHNTQYPLIQIEPPASTIPEIYNGREEYSFEINFFNLYSQSAQSTVVLQQRWDNLQDLALEWLDEVIKYYQTSLSVEVFLNDESIEIERVKEVANDRLVQIKLTFTLSCFTKCFTPQSFYPSNISNLALWLRADSVGTFDIPTKQITSWTDRSGRGFNGAQSVATKKPLWVGYDGAKDKSYVSFDGTDDYMAINTGMLTTENFSMFFVMKQTDISSSVEHVFNINTTTNEDVRLTCKGNKISCRVSDNGGHAAELEGGTASDWNLVELDIEGDSMKFTINNQQLTTNITSYNPTIHNGSTTISAKNRGTDISSYFKGSIQEIIIYNGYLEVGKQRTNLRGYLSQKYNLTTL